MAKKRLTLEKVEAKRRKAVGFLEDVVGDPDRADEFDGMSTKEYADHKGIEIVEDSELVESPGMVENPGRGKGKLVTLNFEGASRMTKQELEERVAELETENEDLHSRLDSVMEIAAPGETDADAGDDEDDGEDDDGNDDVDEEDEGDAD